MSFDFTTIIVAALTAGGTLGVGRAARRSPRQERRDDFDKITTRLDGEIERLERRITRQDTSIAGQAAAIGYLHSWIRSLVAFTRSEGLEPPAAPQPVPDEARPFLHNIGV